MAAKKGILHILAKPGSLNLQVSVLLLKLPLKRISNFVDAKEINCLKILHPPFTRNESCPILHKILFEHDFRLVPFNLRGLKVYLGNDLNQIPRLRIDCGPVEIHLNCNSKLI